MTLPRCSVCGLHLELCACELLPRVRFDTDIVVVQHIGERNKPTNTGRLLVHMVDGCCVTSWGMRDEPFDASPLRRPDTDYLVLFPRADAQVLTHSLARPRSGRRQAFVLLDATWHQSSRMSRRVDVVRDLSCVALPSGAPSRWSVRKTTVGGGLCTLEAACRMLALAEGTERVKPLIRGFHVVTARMLFMKGMLATPEVPFEWSLDG